MFGTSPTVGDSYGRFVINFGTCTTTCVNQVGGYSSQVFHMLQINFLTKEM